MVKTPIYESFIEPSQIDTTLATLDAFHPIGRIGAPEDVAHDRGLLAWRQRQLGDGAIWDVDGRVIAGRN